MSSLEPLKHNHYQCFPAVGSYWLAGPSPQLHCCQTLSHAYVWWKLGWGLADLLCTYGLVLLEGCLEPLAWFIVKAGERLRERVWVPERGRRGGQQHAKRTAAWCMLGNRHAFTFLISWTSSYISTAAILQLIRIFWLVACSREHAFPQAWRAQSHWKDCQFILTDIIQWTQSKDLLV